ncbi:MAG: hypothetical protein K0R24_839 [Gammaproteobacteria bacterium]|jgi:hypothetical protein|nr:hypothetical protein [Gammaproteobacteria bacterium]MCE3237858.1 hypothetical protein [Gammaproteobacteria bacterium]
MLSNKKKDELHPYRKFGITLLQLMAILGVTGVLVTVLFNYFF